MKIPVLTAGGGDRWESGLVQALDRAELGITVVRRCVDVADLLAVAASGTARAAIVSGDLRRLDADALARLAAARVAVVGVVPGADEDAAMRLQHLGVHHVLPGDVAAATIVAAVVDAVARPLSAKVVAAPYDARAAFDEPAYVDDDAFASSRGTGRIVAVWGPTGAPGRTTVAVTLAAEIAALGIDTTLVDADVYGGAVAQLLGLLDESPGLAAAVRQANNGALDLRALAGIARTVSPHLRVLTGIVRAERWPELVPSAFAAVLALLRHLTPVTVVDCGFCLEQDEELAYDLAGARRNGVTLTAIADAEVVLAVGAADALSVQRLVRGLSELAEVLPDTAPHVVVNRVRRSVTPGPPREDLTAALSRYAGVIPVAFIPDDRKGLDLAMSSGRTLTEAAPGSPARQAIATMAKQLVGRPAASRRLLTRR